MMIPIILLSPFHDRAPRGSHWLHRDPYRRLCHLLGIRHHAHYRLDQQPHDTVAFSCLCGLGAVIDRATLIQQVGGDANVLWVARQMMA